MVVYWVINAVFIFIALLMFLYHRFIEPLPLWCWCLFFFLYRMFTPKWLVHQSTKDEMKLIRRWRKIEHKSGLPMAEWEERQRQKELDEKLTAGTYTNAEKEYLIYTAQLETEKKDELRKKHLPKNKRKPGI